MSGTHAHKTHSQISWKLSLGNKEIGFTAWEANQEVGQAEVSNSSPAGSSQVTKGLHIPHQQGTPAATALPPPPGIRQPSAHQKQADASGTVIREGAQSRGT